MDEYKNIVDSNIKPGAYDLIVEYMPHYKVLKSIKIDLKNSEVTTHRRRIQKKLYDCGFVEIYYQFYTKNCFSILNNKYGLVLDALSSKFDFDGLYLNHHLLDYYKDSKTKPVEEFFANLFRSEVTSKSFELDNLRKLLPKSFEAYEKLFSIVYDRILNNKRFTDLDIKIPEKEERKHE